MIRDILIHEKIRTDLPTDYSEISMKQYYEIELWKNRNGNFLELLPILTDVEAEIWDKCNYEDFRQIIAPNLQWVVKPVKWRKIKMLDSIKIMDKEIKFPKNLELETLGQKVQLDIRFSEYLALFEDNEVALGYHQMAYILAVYLSPFISEEEFSVEYTEEIRNEIINLPAMEVLPIGAFFLKKWKGSIRRSVLSSLKNSIRRNVVRMIKHLKNLDFSESGTHSQAEM